MDEFNTHTIESARARVAAQVAEAEARKEAIDQLAEEVRNTTATARAPHGEVVVIAATSGKIISVTLAESSSALAVADLSNLITSTIADAQHSAAMAAVQLSAQTLGAASPLVSQLRSEAEATFPSTETDQITFQ